ncbi:DUF2460 domain-containing protein [Aurantimonas sp. HBX-1]|uniref:DUF2460 domain-containing protein n=1 Tax=Aurantimonas sp. HBX-1 TaxID=2906072 RepID=UPI001F34FAFE|nr:DUF2460 domain-containing protein [Aurantimonas sp. HBX-1]UIJ70631.1 DUF2460 domain-containing protein [Aurantimonas sp. HBX-1]
MAIAAFDEVRFPLRLSFGTSGGPGRRVEIVRLSTGFEHRNLRHRHSVRRYDAGSGLRSLADLAEVLAFFEARRGRLTGFRFRDPLDWHTAPYGAPAGAFDQLLGIGDGVTTRFSLRKIYGEGEAAYHRPIEKPVAGTVTVAVDGVEVAAGFAIDTVSGSVTFAAPPGAGAAVTAGFAFDVPVRFDVEQLSVNVAAFEAGDIPSIPLIEIRP